MPKDFFPVRPELTPLIYAYEELNNPELSSFLKIGYTGKDVQKRIAQQYPTARPGKLPYKIVLEMTGTAATLLAKRWGSALLVNVDNETLARLMANGYYNQT